MMKACLRCCHPGHIQLICESQDLPGVEGLPAVVALQSLFQVSSASCLACLVTLLPHARHILLATLQPNSHKEDMLYFASSQQLYDGGSAQVCGKVCGCKWAFAACTASEEVKAEGGPVSCRYNLLRPSWCLLRHCRARSPMHIP